MSVDHALDLLEQHAGSAKIIAGGQSLNSTLNMRLSAPDLLIDINDLDELKGIELADGRIQALEVAAAVKPASSPSAALS